ncbi:hypothetical protein [Granulicella paludicola]|uniref:hypothetical protein n=1 Tax=Granulicella paludicola TaxID=474951 RepID=UPI0021E0B1F3|nr:hypothetical protein [Granulicella paludicola]
MAVEKSVLLRLKPIVICASLAFALQSHAEPLPAQLKGTWRITKLLPTTNIGCWTADQAASLVGSSLVYGPRSMTWKGGTVPLLGVSTRLVDTDDVKSESGGGAKAADFTQLKIGKDNVLEVNLQHDDADITGASTEVPGDSVLLAAPNRIVASACGVYFEATRVVTPKPKAKH